MNKKKKMSKRTQNRELPLWGSGLTAAAPVSEEVWVRCPGLCSGLKDLAPALARIQFLVQELPYAGGVALKM